MTVNLPPMEQDQARAAWFLELVREINRLESLINQLEQRIRELENA